MRFAICNLRFAIVLVLAGVAHAQGVFHSPAIGKDIAYRIAKPGSGEAAATVIYLENLAVPRAGMESDDIIIDSLGAAGDRVVVIDYAHDAKATSPELNQDLLELRT